MSEYKPTEEQIRKEWIGEGRKHASSDLRHVARVTFKRSIDWLSVAGYGMIAGSLAAVALTLVEYF